MVDSAKGVSRATELSQPALVGELDFPLCGEPAETTLKEGFLEKSHRTHNSVGSTESGYLTCLDSTVKRDLFCSLNLPNRISLSSSTNAKKAGKYPLAVEGEGKRAFFFLAEHVSQRRNGADA